ncbi:MAG: carbonic anhydrase [Rickettsiaceae bacterium]
MTLPKTNALLSFLKKLFDTNTQFATEHSEKFFAKFQDSQNPKLTILKCSDSRVQMESFDKTPQNGVFAIRNIGNQIVTSEGSVDFGIEILNTPFLLIIGHSDCGAVTAALNQTTTSSQFINKELSTLNITQDCLHKAIVENVNNQVTTATNKYLQKINNGTLTVIGAIYDFKNDYGFGNGKVVLTNINGITDPILIQKAYSSKIQNLHCLEKI